MASTDFVLDESARELTPVGRMLQQLRRSAAREPDAEAREAVAELFPQGADRLDYVARFAALIVLSASIAAFGLLADSSAVVIGAMLVAPLMTPILSTAAATVQADNRELVIALGVIALGVVLAVGVGWATSAVAGDVIVGPTELPGEVEARTFPGLLDLGIAITAGAAAGYILPRRKAVSALPGVGIAVALVPPLATVGITFEAGARPEAGNAMLLFLTNLAAIVFAASAMLVLSGFRPRQRISRRRLVTRVTVTTLAVAAVAIPLALHTRATLQDASLRSVTARAVEDWDDSVRIVEMDAIVDEGVAEVELLVSGPQQPDRVWALADAIRAEFGDAVDLELRYQQDLRFTVSSR